MALYCEVSLPVPVDTSFTYAVPPALQPRVQPGCRVIVPLGTRKLTGVILETHDRLPSKPPRSVLRLLDEAPAVASDLQKLGRWIADYYCAPLGETLRAMLPLPADVRATRIVRLTPAGQEASRQSSLLAEADDPVAQILRALETRPLAEQTLKRKFSNAAATIAVLERRGLVAVDKSDQVRDPLRARSGRLMVECIQVPASGLKLSAPESRLVAFLQANPGCHDLAALESKVKGCVAAAKKLGAKGIASLWRAPVEEAGAAFAAKPLLNPEQRFALDAIATSLQDGGFHTFLLHGVTGSGKTAIYLEAIDKALDLGRSALLLVPEIALTPAMAGQFYSRFGDKAAILHSAFSGAERATQWRRIHAGTARVVVGTRSAIFAPVQNPGLIVVDEEHDQSYKQQETPRYNARDVALVRAQAAQATVVLGSATPALESMFNATRDKYSLLELKERVEKRPLPDVELIDMRLEFLETRKQTLFSRRLLEVTGQRLSSGEQVMIFLNRRGFASFVACRSCGARLECRNCSVTLTYHRREERLLCHYCDYAEPVPSACPKCAGEFLYFLGSGTEKVEETLHQSFPRARIARLDRDTARGRQQYETILNAFREGLYDILVGTQMIAKGHDIPNVTLVGVVSADIALGLPDFRAAERTFQLLTQVAGRAGRGERRGQVLIQTINPEHYAIRFAAAQDYPGFFEKELQFRRLMHYPPFTVMANVIVRSQKQEEALHLSRELGDRLRNPPENVRVLGPAAAALVRLKTDYRFQFLMKASSRRALGALLHEVRQFAKENRWPATALMIDVDPLSLM